MKILEKIIIITMLAIIAYALLQISSLRSQISEITQTTNQTLEAADYISDFGTDLNEIRELLLLPTKDYSLTDEKDTQEESEEDEIITNMFNYINVVSDSVKKSQVISELDAFFNSEETKTLLAEKGLSKEEGKYLMHDASSIKIIEISVSDNGYCNIETYFGEVITEEGTPTEVISEFETVIGNLDSIKEKINNVESAKATLRTILYESGTAYEALKAKGMWADTETDIGLSFDYNLVNQDQTILAAISLSKEDPTFITWGVFGSEKKQIGIDATMLAELINGLDSSTILENKIAENKTKMESLLQDAGFQTALADNNLNMSDTREDDTGIYYDITDSTGAVLSTIYIDKKTGKAMIENTDGDTIELISAVNDDFSKKKLWNYPNRYLITGIT